MLFFVLIQIEFHNFYERFFLELLIIEQRLMSPFVFAGYNILNSSNLSHTEIELQEILIPNSHLLQLTQKETKLHEKEFESEGVKYRKVYYKNSDIK